MEISKRILRPGLLVVFSLILLPSQAQVWKNMGKKIEQKVEDQASRRLERKIDQAIDKGFDATEQAIDESVKGNGEKPEKAPSQTTSRGNNSSESAIAAAMLNMGGNTKVLDQYQFGLGINYTITTTKANGKTESVPGMMMWMSDKGYTGVGESSSNSFVVMDMENKTMVMFQPAEKTYMALSTDIGGMMEKMAGQQIADSDPDPNVKFEKLSRTEKILGYTCEIYKIESDDTEAMVWVTQDLNVDYSGFASSFGNMMKNAKAGGLPPAYQKFVTGVFLKTESVEKKKKGEKFVMEATKVDKDGKTVSMADYKRTGM